MKDWKIIIQHQNLDEKKKMNLPKVVIDTVRIEFDSKEEAFKKYAGLFNVYEEKSYDYNIHSFGATKFYHEADGRDILTYVLLYHKGKEYMEATEEDEELLDSFIESEVL